MNYKTKIFTRISSVLVVAFLCFSCANEEPSNDLQESKNDVMVVNKSSDSYKNALVTVFLENGKLALKDNQGNPFDENNPEEFLTYTDPNGSITWELGNGLSSIAITIDSGQDIFENLPKNNGDGSWTGTIADLDSGEAKYSITYTISGDDTIFVLDPVVRISSNPPPK